MSKWSTIEGLTKIELPDGDGSCIYQFPLPTILQDVWTKGVQDALCPAILKQRTLNTPRGKIPFPRLTGLVASEKAVKDGVRYSYSGGSDPGFQETKWQRKIRHYINRMLGTRCNSALVNAYGYKFNTETSVVEPGNGDNASIGRHSDDEQDLVDSKVIGISYQPVESDIWMLRFRSKTPQETGKRPKYTFVDVPMKHGMVYVMHGSKFHQNWTHEIPKSTKKWPHPGQRVSFTFRQLATSYGVSGGKLPRNTIQTQRSKPY